MNDFLFHELMRLGVNFVSSPVVYTTDDMRVSGHPFIECSSTRNFMATINDSIFRFVYRNRLNKIIFIKVDRDFSLYSAYDLTLKRGIFRALTFDKEKYRLKEE